MHSISHHIEHCKTSTKTGNNSPPSSASSSSSQSAAAEDLAITRIAGLTWAQWNASLAMPLVTHMQEGGQPLVFGGGGGGDSGGGSGSIGSDTPAARSPAGSCGSEHKYSPVDIIVDSKQHLLMSGSAGGSGGNGGGSGGHANGLGYPCPDCGRLYKLKSSLRNHQKWECGKEPQFQCQFCPYKAKQKMHIGRHLERMHKDLTQLQFNEATTGGGVSGHMSMADAAEMMMEQPLSLTTTTRASISSLPDSVTVTAMPMNLSNFNTTMQ